ncbi:MAG: hypothetical protein NTY39_08435 [Campylobacterales bacterium]|nr:hypothetical protein [Campylobacterales bacterium]
MELKDVILSTLAELEESVQLSKAMQPIASVELIETSSIEEVFESKSLYTPPLSDGVNPIISTSGREDEVRLLEGVRERLLVLFEGFQSPNNVQIEAKVDLTLNFLEYLLATIDNRLESFKENK